MRECVLLFQFEPEKQRKLAAQLLMARFRVKAVTAEEWDLPIGYLAGDKEVVLDETETEEGPEAKVEDGAGRSPMIVMAGLTGQRVNAVLQAIRKAGIGPVPYKAVLTETNRTWKAARLLEELRKEHEEMSRQEGEGKMLHEQ